MKEMGYDNWKGQLIRMIVLALQQALQQQKKHSHVFMTTHSSITLSDVSRRNIWILQREQDYTERAIPPNLRTLGTDPGDISIAVFGSQNAVGSQSVQYIFQTIHDARKLDSSEQRTKLSQLLHEVGPGYGPGEALRKTALLLAEQEGLPLHWLQQTIERCFPGRTLSDGAIYPGLHIYVAPLGYLLTMLLLFGKSVDDETIRALAKTLALSTPTKMFSLVKAYLPEQIIPSKEY